MNTETMNTNENAPSSTHHVAYLNAKKYGFDFKIGEKQYEERTNKKEEIIKDMGEKPKPFKVIISFACIAIAIVLGYIEAQNIKTSIIGNGTINEMAVIIIGWTYACLGLVTGELLSSGMQKDKFTGRKKPTAQWYIGLALTLLYIFGQYYLASRAGIGAEDELQETVTTMKWFVIGIAITEVLFGVLFIKTALQVFTLYTANIGIKISMGKMNRTSRHTEEYWQRYLFESTGTTQAEETQAIKDAREFYNNGGFASGYSLSNP